MDVFAACCVSVEKVTVALRLSLTEASVTSIITSFLLESEGGFLYSN